MSKEKQIEEMAKDVNEAIRHNSAVDVIRHGLICVNSEGVTRELHDEGYRKQSEGEWILTQEKRLFGDKYYTCSNCQSRNPTMIKFNYCFNCGAKMKGGAE